MHKNRLTKNQSCSYSEHAQEPKCVFILGAININPEVDLSLTRIHLSAFYFSSNLIFYYWLKNFSGEKKKKNLRVLGATNKKHCFVRLSYKIMYWETEIQIKTMFSKSLNELGMVGHTAIPEAQETGGRGS